MFTILQLHLHEIVKHTTMNTTQQSLSNPGKLNLVPYQRPHTRLISHCRVFRFHSGLFCVDNRLHAYNQRRLVHTPPGPLFATDPTDCAAHTLTPQEARLKSRRPSHSAWANFFCNALNSSKPTGIDDFVSFVKF